MRFIQKNQVVYSLRGRKNKLKKYKHINRIGFDYHESALRWKKLAKSEPEYKDCIFSLRMDISRSGKWIIDIYRKEAN